MKFTATAAIITTFALSLNAAIAGDYVSLAGSEWGTKTKFDQFLRFEAGGKVTGHAGCNGFFGTYDITGKRLRFGAMGATKKLCEPDRMKAERKFFEILKKTDRADRSGHRLQLFDADGAVLVRLKQRDWD